MALGAQRQEGDPRLRPAREASPEGSGLPPLVTDLLGSLEFAPNGYQTPSHANICLSSNVRRVAFNPSGCEVRSHLGGQDPWTWGHLALHEGPCQFPHCARLLHSHPAHAFKERRAEGMHWAGGRSRWSPKSLPALASCPSMTSLDHLNMQAALNTG